MKEKKKNGWLDAGRGRREFKSDFEDCEAKECHQSYILILYYYNI
jgi:hypothetical protein